MSRHSVALSSFEKWEMEGLNISFSMPTLMCEGFTVKLTKNINDLLHS